MRKFGVFVLLLLLTLVGCSERGAVEASSGAPLTPEEQQSLYEQRQELDGQDIPSYKGTVYWTQSGSKYHKDPNCSYIRNAKQLQSGKIEQAINHGASEPCSRCAE